jgi:L-methionine (R)-S-oxide reductase
MDYELLLAQVDALLADEDDLIANAANFAAFVYHEIQQINWAGFYFTAPSGELVLGPFNGRPACTRLPRGRGVCGSALACGQVVVIDDVHQFPDHIECDRASASEMVVPLIGNNGPFGVFDLDSPVLARFTAADRAGIERLVACFVNRVRRAASTAS